MIQAGYRYQRTTVDIEKFLEDTGNVFRVVNRKHYKGNPKKGIEAGYTFTLQIKEDRSDLALGKVEGKEPISNVFESFDATVVGLESTDIQKGDWVSLDNPLAEISYYINWNFILRFGGIHKVQLKKKGE